MCAYQGVKNVRFLEYLACFVLLKHSFSDSPVCVITDEHLFIAPINRVLPIGLSLSVKKNWRELLTRHKPSIKWRVIESFEVEINLFPALLFLFMPKKWKKPRGQRWMEAKLLKRNYMFAPPPKNCVIQLHLKQTPIWFLKVGISEYYEHLKSLKQV